MSSTRYRIPLQDISPNIIPKPSEPGKTDPIGKCKVTRLSSLFGKSSSHSIESTKPGSSAVERDQTYVHQNASLARNIAYLSKQIQNVQQENVTLHHRVALYENVSRIQQQRMKQSEEALEQITTIRNDLIEALLHLEKDKEQMELESD